MENAFCEPSVNPLSRLPKYMGKYAIETQYAGERSFLGGGASNTAVKVT